MPGMPEALGLSPQRVMTLTIHKVKDGVLWDAEASFREIRQARIRLRGSRWVYLRVFHNISVLDLLLMKPIEGLSVVGLQGILSILAQQFIDFML